MSPNVYAFNTVGKQAQEEMRVCPMCKQSIRASEMDAHVRIELLDPKYRDQKKAFQAKLDQTNLATSDVIAAQLSTLAETSEVFTDKSGTAKPTVAPVAWDGN
jgi:splicing factor 3A subunit 1